MDWIMGLQRAVDYIEAHLTEQISYEDVAREAYVSPFYFQRVFSILCGYTVGEYIRNRRLTLAGSELLATDQKVIDLALKYGYETPESFTRAFTRFHGITPSAARLTLAPLTSFARLSIQISMKGGERMQYRIANKDSFRIVAKGTRCSEEDEKNREEIPAFGSAATGMARSNGCVSTGKSMERSAAISWAFVWRIAAKRRTSPL